MQECTHLLYPGENTHRAITPSLEKTWFINQKWITWMCYIVIQEETRHLRNNKPQDKSPLMHEYANKWTYTFYTLYTYNQVLARESSRYNWACYVYTNHNVLVLWRLTTVPDWEGPGIPMRTQTNGTVVNGSEESWLRRFSTLANALHVALSRPDHPTPSAPDYHSGGECSKHALVHPLI